MAELAVFHALRTLTDPIIKEAVLLHRVSDDVDWLKSEMRWMQSFLKETEAKRRRDRSELINNWVREVREVAQEAEDIIDGFMIAVDPQQRLQRRIGGLMGRILRYTSFPFEVKSRHKVGAEIQKLRAKIQQIKASRVAYDLVDLGDTPTAPPTFGSTISLYTAHDEPLTALAACRRIAHHLDNDDAVLIGFDAHKEAIVGQLLDADIKRRCVVSIVGIGGIGKTTLATKIYNNSKIKTCFGIHACVSVSQVYKYDNMLRRIVQQVMGTSMKELQSMEIDDLELRLCQFLKERRYFIVLDDVWHTDVWDRTSKVLPDVNNGSRVLVTTRDTKVATSADLGIPPYQLPLLDDKQSWELFLNKAFPKYIYSERFSEEELENLMSKKRKELEYVGSQLVKRCGGLPLALVVLGGLLSMKVANHAEWTRMVDRMDWASTKDGQNCLEILALSYHDLPGHYISWCFLYLAVYPDNWEFHESEVVNLWVAEGLIPDESRFMEETARSYFNELVDRSMIQLIYPSLSAHPIYKVHDLFRDFCTTEARKEGFLDVYDADSLLEKTRHDRNPCRRLALHCHSTNEVKDWCPPPNLRSLLAFETELNNEIFNGLKLSRVARLSTPTIFPKQLLECMIHLRYLCLRGFNELTELPSSIRNLCNLQTLDVQETGIRSLPDSLGKIKTLRHLYLFSGCNCTPSIGNLINLKTLTMPSARGGWIEHGLKKLVNIEILRVTELKATQGEVFISSLPKMKRLSTLELSMGPGEVISKEFIMAVSKHDFLSDLELLGRISQGPQGHLMCPRNLIRLKLFFSRLPQDPMPVLEKLPFLITLQLLAESYIGGEMVCTAGGFPTLQELRLEELTNLEHWRIEGKAMPKLNGLRIWDCRRLAMLPEGLQHLTSLKHLEIADNREEFQSRVQNEDWYKIHHVRTILISRSEF